jgi:hypothetical protein
MTMKIMKGMKGFLNHIFMNFVAFMVKFFGSFGFQGVDSQ